MARLLLSARGALQLHRQMLALFQSIPSRRSYITAMRQSAFKDNLLRILRTEITYESEHCRPKPPSHSFGPFSIEDNPGEQWVRLRRQISPTEHLQVDATMFDGAAALPDSLAKKVDAMESDGARLHISLAVEVSKGGSCPWVLQFVCSAWPDALDVEKVFPVAKDSVPLRPYMGRDFKELDDELQEAVRGYLEERGVDDDLAEFLHGYMANKDKAELVRWLRNVEAYVQK
ncbi:putative mitochondrial glycoprotein [Dioscorea sansibarensis]